MGIMGQICKKCGRLYIGNPVKCPLCGASTKAMKVDIPNALPETKEHYVNKLMKVAPHPISQDHIIFLYQLEIPYLEAKYRLEKLSAKLNRRN